MNQRPKTHYKLQIRNFSSHTSLFRTLPEQLGTDDTTHVSQPILYQRPKIQHKRLMTQFCKPILIQPPKIHLSKKNQCSPYRRQKCRALQEDTVEWKPVCNLQAKNGSQYASVVETTCAQPIAKMLSRGVPLDKILWLHGEIKIKILKYVKRDQKIKNEAQHAWG